MKKFGKLIKSQYDFTLNYYKQVSCMNMPMKDYCQANRELKITLGLVAWDTIFQFPNRQNIPLVPYLIQVVKNMANQILSSERTSENFVTVLFSKPKKCN